MNDTPQSSHRPGWVSIALIISLCLNFLFIGMFSTALWQRYDTFRGPPPGVAPRSGGAPGSHADMGPGQQGGRHARVTGHGVLIPRLIMDAVPEKAADIRAVMQSRRPGMQPLRQAAIAARQKVHALMTDKAYSAEKLKAALAEVKNADMALEAYTLETLHLCYGKLDGAERKKVAEISLQAGREFRRKHLHMRGSGMHGGSRGQRHGMNGATPSE